MEQSAQNIGEFCLNLEGALGRGSGSAGESPEPGIGDSDRGSGASQCSHLGKSFSLSAFIPKGINLLSFPAFVSDIQRPTPILLPFQ